MPNIYTAVTHPTGVASLNLCISEKSIILFICVHLRSSAFKFIQTYCHILALPVHYWHDRTNFVH
ncbi:hypothetical protein [Anabaena azotica]|uniref:Uncharacterized protein n=1 Tax=Anabaena azotica FACHB-119 TaxID=947527 RepID=A0ABR8D9E5_9NOST|nr:hypothetical protein [Anabaena azotica]MBD2502822.1 hypothetical protein [Anabaena azotica FACHB-119]